MPTVGEALEQARQLQAAGKFAEAERVYRLLIAAIPDAAEVWARLGVFYLEAGRPDAAVGPMEAAVARDSAQAAYHGALGAAFRSLKRHDEALGSFRQALLAAPPTPEALNNLALACKDVGRYDEALAAFDQALALRAAFQNGHYNRGNLLLAMGRYAEAIGGFRRALELNPGDAAAHCSLGAAHAELLELDEAMASYDRALALRPEYPEARRNQAVVWFQQGDYARAWAAFEARFACDDYARRDFPFPLWDGSSLAGRTLLVHAEQGLGDTLQFVRYLPLAARAAGRVWFEPQEPLRPLLAQSPFRDFLVPLGQRPQCDFHAPLMGLPRYLPDAEGRPFWPGPYLHASPELSAQWRSRLPREPGFNVGIVWAGNPQQPRDPWRSTRLANFAPLAAVPGVRLISLQKGTARQRIADEAKNWQLEDFGDQLDASAPFLDTSALINELDLVISVDTAVAHLAGALGKPVWLALQFASDWRWRAEGDTTPWYPTMRLLRQRQLNDWPQVFADMAIELRRHVAAR